MSKNNTTTDSIETNKNTILFSLIKFNETNGKPPLHPLTPNYNKQALDTNMASETGSTTMSAPTSFMLTKNPITFTEEEAKVSSRWKKYIYKIHHLIMDEIPNMCLVNKSNNKYEYESSCGTQKVQFICRFEGVPHRQYCTGVIIDDGTPIYHKTKKTPKKLYKSLYIYLDKYYMDYLLDKQMYKGRGSTPKPTIRVDDNPITSTSISTTKTISTTSSPSSSDTYGGGTTEFDFYDDDTMYDESMWADH